MLITARFKGKDGSLGYIKGQPYALSFGVIRKNHHEYPDHCFVHLADKNPATRKLCMYGSLYKFLQNWEVI